MHRRSAIALLCLAAALDARAATFCVSTPAQFQAAYDTARTNSQSNTIRMRKGSYQVPGGGIGSQALYDYDSGGTLTIEGGWTGATASSCDSRTDDPSLTVVDGGSLHRGMFISADTADLDVTVRNLTFADGRAIIVVQDDRGAGLRIESSGAVKLNVTVDRCAFRGNLASYLGGGLYIGATGGVLVRNSLFVGNQSLDASAALYVLSNGALQSIVNNTIADNVAGDDTSNAAAMYTEGNAVRVVENNIIWHNTTSSQDDVFGPAALYVRNIIEKVEGAPQAGSSLNQGSDPLFVDPDVSYRLEPDSPAVNAGDNAPYGGTAAVDLANQPRVSGARIDLGAYESEVLLKDGFE